jgi:3-methylcrotonyl-CoA carboxylase alpha subunit
VIEEAPAPDIAPELRRAMSDAAVAAAMAIDYRGAGTIEFLLCEGAFYFMEMNTRLQVEHPVTEAVTGLDLVAWQLAVAEGRPLPLSQHQVQLRGHAVEARLYAEDVAAGFLPASGPIHWLHWPTGVRIDTGVAAGDAVSPYYDPMIAKLVAHGEHRAQALARLSEALTALEIGPLTHNGALLARLCQEPDVLGMRHHTQWPLPTDPQPLPELAGPLATLWLAHSAASSDPWHKATGFRLGRHQTWTAAVTLAGQRHQLTLHSSEGKLSWQGQSIPYVMAEDHIRLQWQGRWQRYPVRTLRQGDQRQPGFVLTLAGQQIPFGPAQEVAQQDHHGDEASGRSVTLAPMHGLVVALLIEAGQAVSRGQPLLVLEAMKMEHQLRAQQDGVIAELLCREGDQVSQGAPLVRFLESTEAAS